MTETWLVSDAAPYDGRPNSDDHTRWLPSQTRGAVCGGAPAWGGWANGSLSWENHIRMFGRYDVRLRSWPHPILSWHLLLWPQSENWPPEIDIAESFHSSRKRISGFLHGLTGGHSKQQFDVDCDLANPTTFSVLWEQSRLRFACDGVVFGDTDWDVPQEPHRLAIQVETHASWGGWTADKRRVLTQRYGPPDPKRWVPVVEVLDVKYTEVGASGFEV